MGDLLEVFANEVVEHVSEDARSELSRVGIHVGEVEELDTYGTRYCVIVFRDVSVDLENAELRRSLSEASSSWDRLFKALALERLVLDEGLRIYDYVDVEEVSWSRRYGPFVKLYVSAEVDELLRRCGLEGEVDVREMEEALEGLLDYEARRILRTLNEAVKEFFGRK